MHDHRKLGRELDIFDTDPLIGSGLPFWLPAGAAIRHELEEYIRELELQAGYQHVFSPVLAKRELYEISGHWEHYQDGMYPPMTVGSEQVILRPSLCPHHALMFRARARSYRDLPLRIAELGGQYRSELSGVLGGLTRVRAMQLNDGHIFCTPGQVAAESGAALGMIRQAHRALGIEPARYRLSLASPDAKYAGEPSMWDRATAILRDVLVSAGLEYDAEAGEAAFYGPKIDVQVADNAEREATIATIQVDFYQPERFALGYTGPDGSKQRPVMIHRSIIGSVERQVAHLLDTHGGAFPPWLAPVQLVVLPVTDGQRDQASYVVSRAREQGLRAQLASADSVAARIRVHRHVPYQAVIGAAEVEAGEVSVRLRDGRKLPPMPVSDALDRIGRLVKARTVELWDVAAP
ncbi:MAG: threonine--tRNA ligase [Actinobacteria bacterium]|nr:threonine--tRNA ligase [Actinomycetota bacterium]